MWGAIEAGGTKWNVAVGTGPHDLVDELRVPTTTPDETLATVVRFLRRHAVAAIGLASFGPLELRRDHPAYGSIGATPKPGWSGCDLVGRLTRELDVPVALETDVTGAALGEARWGAGRGFGTFVYLTVGTGIGGGAVVAGRPLTGLGHPEMGHVPIARHPDDDFPGRCRFHGDCLEGLASGPAIEQRWGATLTDLTGDTRDRALAIETFELAEGLRSIVCTLAPHRIIVGGGVSKADGLFPLLRAALHERLAGYPGLPEHTSEEFVVPPALGDLAGIAGAFVLAAHVSKGAAGSLTSHEAAADPVLGL